MGREAGMRLILSRIAATVRKLCRVAAREEGGSLVEFAVSTAVLFTVVIGVMEASFALFTDHLVAEYAREGSRYAMVRGNTCTVSGVSCTATTTQIKNYVKNLGYPGINPSSMSVTVTYSAFPSGTCTPNTNCANPGNLVTVQVTYPFVFSVPFALSSTWQLSSTSSMVISQ